METIELSTNEVEVVLDGEGVAFITLNRPERMNAMTVSLLDSLAEAIAILEEHQDARTIVLTGAGDAFCAGGDVKQMSRGGKSTEKEQYLSADLIETQKIVQRNIVNRIWRMPKPVIASLPGPAVGAGLSLALACDFRIAAEEAILNTAFARLGLAGDLNVAFFLTQLVGVSRTKELLFHPQPLSAREAMELGLVNHVVPRTELDEATLEMARRYASGPTAAIGMIKNHINLAVEGDIDESLNLEVEDMVRGMKTSDHKEAILAMIEKRPPEFKGH